MLARLGNITAPFCRCVLVRVNPLDETFNEVALASQLQIRHDTALDVCRDRLIGVVRAIALLHEHKSVVNVDVDLLKQFHLEDEVIVD